jgi:SAM-dependent methyltransferase
MSETGQEADAYAQYQEFKSWKDEQFAQLNDADRQYFDIEMSAAIPQSAARLRVLEIGFGNGCFLAYGQSRGWNMFGTEVNAELLDRARSKGFACGLPDAVAQIEDESLDLIVAFDVLEHIPASEAPAHLRQWVRKLRPGGFFMARVPNGDSPAGLVHQNGDLTHVTAYGAGKIRHLAALSGIRVVSIQGVAVVIRHAPWKRRVVRSARWVAHRLIDRLYASIFHPGAERPAVSATDLVFWLQR